MTLFKRKKEIEEKTVYTKWQEGEASTADMVYDYTKKFIVGSYTIKIHQLPSSTKESAVETALKCIKEITTTDNPEVKKLNAMLLNQAKTLVDTMENPEAWKLQAQTEYAVAAHILKTLTDYDVVSEVFGDGSIDLKKAKMMRPIKEVTDRIYGLSDDFWKRAYLEVHPGSEADYRKLSKEEWDFYIRLVSTVLDEVEYKVLVLDKSYDDVFAELMLDLNSFSCFNEHGMVRTSMDGWGGTGRWVLCEKDIFEHWDEYEAFDWRTI